MSKPSNTQTTDDLIAWLDYAIEKIKFQSDERSVVYGAIKWQLLAGREAVKALEIYCKACKADGATHSLGHSAIDAARKAGIL